MQTPRRRRGKTPGWTAPYVVTVNGKREWRSAGTFASKRDAQDAINRALNDHQQGKWIDPQNHRMLVRDWAQKWYGLRSTPSMKIRSVLDARIIPYWGDRELGQVRRLDVQQWVKQLSDDGLSPETVRNYYAVMRQMMNAAVEFEMLGRNPCRLEQSDMPRKSESTKVFLTDAECAKLLDLAPDRYRAMIHLGLASGLRVGELITLRWSDVDLVEGTVIVRSEHAKNGKSRVVWISQEAVGVLRAHRRDFASPELVFVAEKGGAVNYDNFRARTWAPLAKKALAPDRQATFHCLRHTYASRMLAAGADGLVLARMLGHHKPSFTLDVYGHATPRGEKQYRTLIEEQA